MSSAYDEYDDDDDDDDEFEEEEEENVVHLKNRAFETRISPTNGYVGDEVYEIEMRPVESLRAFVKFGPMYGDRYLADPEVGAAWWENHGIITAADFGYPGRVWRLLPDANKCGKERKVTKVVRNPDSGELEIVVVGTVEVAPRTNVRKETRITLELKNRGDIDEAVESVRRACVYAEVFDFDARPLPVFKTVHDARYPNWREWPTTYADEVAGMRGR